MTINTTNKIEPYTRLFQSIMETELPLSFKVNISTKTINLYNNSDVLLWMSVEMKLGEDNTKFINNLIKELKQYKKELK